MISIAALVVIAFLASSVLGRGGGRVWGGRSRRLELERDAETTARLARMEEAIQVMATEIERLRAAREREERYLAAGAEVPRVPPAHQNDFPSQ